LDDLPSFGGDVNGTAGVNEDRDERGGTTRNLVITPLYVAGLGTFGEDV